MDFAVSCDRRPGVAVLQVSGGLDAETSPLVLACAEAGLQWSPHLLVDLSGVISFDDCALSVIADLRDRDQRSGGRLSTTDNPTDPPQGEQVLPVSLQPLEGKVTTTLIR